MKNYVYLLLLVLGVTSCGSLKDLSISTNTCIPSYQQGVHGFGLYDCYGRIIHYGAYNFGNSYYGYGFNNGFRNYNVWGPRIVIRNNNIPVSKPTTVRGGRGERVTTGTPRRGGNTGGKNNAHKVIENTAPTGDHIHVGYTCPEDEIFELYNTYKTRFNNYGKMFYLWQCFGDSDHKFWIKA